MAAVLIQQIEGEIAEANRLIAELRFTMALAQSSDEDTSEMQVRLQEMLRVLLVLKDQRAEASHEPITLKTSGAEQARPPQSRDLVLRAFAGKSRPGNHD
jgi:hypothetical protein